MRDAESADNAPPYEVLHIFCRDGGKGFDLDPFGKVVDSHQEELGLPFSWGERIDNVHSPNGEQPCAAFPTLCGEGGRTPGTWRIFSRTRHNRPVWSANSIRPSKPWRPSSSPRVISADPLMDLGQNVLSPLVSDTF